MNFWLDKRVWVTGGNGFLGKVVESRIRECGCSEVLATGRRECDLLDVDNIKRCLSDFKPNIVIHLAAVVGGIGANREKPAEFYYQNLMMGTQLMHECWKQAVDKFVAIGTICAYPKYTPVPFVETNLWNGYPEETNAPYGLAKKMLLVQAQAYRQQYGWNAIYLLPINLYGPGDNFDPLTSHVIPALIKKLVDARNARSDHVVVWGDGTPTRGFLYVFDAAEGIVLAAEKYDKSDPVNIGSNMEIKIRDLAHIIAELVGFKGKIIWDSNKPNGQPRRCLDVSRAELEFGFKATTTFEEGLKRTVRWYETEYLHTP